MILFKHNEQLENALPLMLVTKSGIMTLVRLMQLANIASLILQMMMEILSQQDQYQFLQHVFQQKNPHLKR